MFPVGRYDPLEHDNRNETPTRRKQSSRGRDVANSSNRKSTNNDDHDKRRKQKRKSSSRDDRESDGGGRGMAQEVSSSVPHSFSPTAGRHDHTGGGRSSSSIKRKKRGRQHDDDGAGKEGEDQRGESPATTLKVIAPDQEMSATKHRGGRGSIPNKVAEEAFDDLDVDVTAIEVEELLLENDDREEGEYYELHQQQQPHPGGKETGDKMFPDDDTNDAPDAVKGANETARGARGDVTATNESGGSRAAGRTVPPGQVSREEIETALYMSKIPILEAAEKYWKLAPFLIRNLQRDGYESFFPIQALSIPDVLASERYGHYLRAQDICIAAPTGSGKTLAYVLPILNALASTSVMTGDGNSTRLGRRKKRLRALVVLPSRDLASQVYQVFQSYVQGSDLRVGLAIGQSNFKSEQIALTVGADNDNDNSRNDSYDDDDYDEEALRHRLRFEPGNVELALRAFRDPPREEHVHIRGDSPVLDDNHENGRSSIDVLVCTPGRLVDHLDNTPGFTLQHLRFLVVDEADRLLSQRFHNWIERVFESTNSASTAAYRKMMTDTDDDSGSTIATMARLPELYLSRSNPCSFRIDPITWRRGGTRGDDFSADINTNDAFRTGVVASVCRPVQLRKILVSATLTRDPQKLAQLRLVNPKHFDVHQMFQNRTASGGDNKIKKYSMPPGLEEYTVECTAEQKPLVLLALLLERIQEKKKLPEKAKNIIVIFTASLDSTHRLVRLLQLLWIAAGFGRADAVAEFSSSLSQKQRSALVDRCNNTVEDDNGGVAKNDKMDELSVVVCSDGMSRGLDILSVSTVINYDVPGYAKTYVHRCGRTARAGRRGEAISLLKGGQVGQFRKMRRLIVAPESVQPIGVQKSLVRGALAKYSACLRALRDVLDAEENGDVNHLDVEGLHDFLSEGQK